MIGWKGLNSNSCLLVSNTHAHSAYTHTHTHTRTCAHTCTHTLHICIYTHVCNMQTNEVLTPANLVDRIYSVK